MNEQTSSGAVASLVLGISSVVLLGLLTGIPAVICGHVSLSHMKRDPLLTGRGLAIAGLVTGYIGIAWSIVVIAIMVGLIATSKAPEPFTYTLF